MVTEPAAAPVTISARSLDHLTAVAVRAGQATLAHYHSGMVVEQKGDRGPVTAADRAAHEVIVEALHAWDPAIPIISEEGVIPPKSERAGWRRFWLVDPLDGTKEFVHRNGEFTVNIGLIEDGIPVLGVIHAPARDLTYRAGHGLGAWRRRSASASTFEPIWSSPPVEGQPLRIAESRSHPSAELESWIGTVPVAARVSVGSSLKFCLVAEGSADVYPRLGPTMEWDVAAGDCIYRNSGRHVARESPLRYNQPTLRNPGFILGLGR